MNAAPLNSLVNHLFPGTGIRTIERLTGGVSAEVYRLGLTLTDGGTQSLVLRLHGASHSGHSADLEYKLLQSLHRSGLPVPEPLLVDVSGSRLQDPFLIMEFIEGETAIPSGQEDHYIDVMAEVLAGIHDSPTADLPTLPLRIDPLPEVFDYLPEDREWEELRVYLRSLDNTAYMESPGLLHGDFWPENLLWRDGSIAAVLDWEDAALGDPLSDVACCRFGKKGMQRCRLLPRGAAVQVREEGHATIYDRLRPVPQHRPGTSGALAGVCGGSRSEVYGELGAGCIT